MLENVLSVWREYLTDGEYNTLMYMGKKARIAYKEYEITVKEFVSQLGVKGVERKDILYYLSRMDRKITVLHNDGKTKTYTGLFCRLSIHIERQIITYSFTEEGIFIFEYMRIGKIVDEHRKQTVRYEDSITGEWLTMEFE